MDINIEKLGTGDLEGQIGESTRMLSALAGGFRELMEVISQSAIFPDSIARADLNTSSQKADQSIETLFGTQQLPDSVTRVSSLLALEELHIYLNEEQRMRLRTEITKVTRGILTEKEEKPNRLTNAINALSGNQVHPIGEGTLVLLRDAIRYRVAPLLAIP